MNNDSRQRLVRAAAQNNAEWCDAFCRTHGVIGVFDSERWFSPVRTPPYYPDVVTLTPEVRIEQALAGADAGDGCSVKDSFASLDVAGAGFGELLRGQWVVREATEAEAPPGWAKIEDDDELREWEAAWGDQPNGPGFFRAALLADDTVAVLAGRSGDEIMAGAIANRSANVIGLTNVFHRNGDLASVWNASAIVAGSLWGALPTVGYDSGEALDAAQEASFESIGELVVWLKGL